MKTKSIRMWLCRNNDCDNDGYIIYFRRPSSDHKVVSRSKDPEVSWRLYDECFCSYEFENKFPHMKLKLGEGPVRIYVDMGFVNRK